MDNHNFEELCINTIRCLAADAVQKANSGHPGMPMGAAPMAHVLWTQFLNHNPQDPNWPNRDRFILSAGHGCMLLYNMLHLTGYDVTMDDIKNFRQLGSITPGHPEHGLTPGVEVTTGPLGQGFANGVGFAMGQKYLAARYNRPDFELFNYHIFAICSDGDLMEGISSEVASLAGHLKLGNIIYLYDDNHISIEGETELAFTESVNTRFEAFGWHVQMVNDGNDTKAIKAAIEAAIAKTNAPSIINVRTHIAFGSPNKVNTSESHGSPLGAEEVALTKKNLGWDPEKYFFIPEEVSKFYRKAVETGKEKQSNWQQLFEEYKIKYPELAEEYEKLSRGQLPEGWQKKLPVFSEDDGPIATRKASEKVINAVAPLMPNLIGGSADLAPSTNTYIKSSGDFSAGNYGNRNFRFGVREHAMGAILNGLNLTPGIRAYGATFLIFSDYMRPAIRLAAIMKILPIYVFTHDSIGLGEDGTTHQPIEHLMSLRAIPNLTIIRPADANETTHAWRVALEHTDGPVALVLTRQNLPVIDLTLTTNDPEQLEKGAYVLRDSERQPDVILIASGSEVKVAIEAQEALQKQDISARVVSMPSWELFEKQDAAYKEKVFPAAIKKRVAIEAGATLGWYKYVTDEGAIIGIDRFGESAPGGQLMKEFGFTAENVTKKVQQLLRGY